MGVHHTDLIKPAVIFGSFFFALFKNGEAVHDNWGDPGARNSAGPFAATGQPARLPLRPVLTWPRLYLKALVRPSKPFPSKAAVFEII